MFEYLKMLAWSEKTWKIGARAPESDLDFGPLVPVQAKHRDQRVGSARDASTPFGPGAWLAPGPKALHLYGRGRWLSL